MKIRIDALGDLLVHVDGEVSPELRGMRSRLALLIYLAVERDSNRDALKAVLWPESDTTTARHALRQALYHIRGVVGEDWIDQAGDVLHATESLTSDVGDFQAALAAGEWERAASLYRGPFLESIHLVSSHPWDAWVDRCRLTLARDYRHACREWVEERLAAYNVDGALHAARIWVRPDPLEDEAQHRLIELLAVSGRRMEALEHYESYRRLLASESLEPLEDTIRLAEGIRRGEVPHGDGLNPSQSASQLKIGPVSETGNLTHAQRANHEVPVAPTGRPPPPGFHESARPSRLSRRAGRRAGIAALMTIVAAALIGAFWFTTRPKLEDGRTVAIPFANLTGDPDLDGIGLLIADRITLAVISAGVSDIVSTEDMLRARVETGASVTGQNAPRNALAVARSARASNAITGSFFVDDGALLFEAFVLDASSGLVVRSIGNVRGRLDELPSAIATLTDRVVGAMATLTDINMSNWSDRASQPPDYRAYSHYAAGIEAFLYASELGVAQRLERQAMGQKAEREFLTASSLDSTFTAPLIWAMFASQSRARLDSIGRILEARYESLAPWDRGMADWILNGGLGGLRLDFPAALEGARQVAAHAPDSEWLYKLAYVALPLNRPYEALDALDRIDPELGWIRRWPSYWSVLARTLHRIGEHERELAAAEHYSTFDSVGAWPYEASALVGLGRDRDAVQLVRRVTSEIEPTMFWIARMNDVVTELRLHRLGATADEVASISLPWAQRATLDQPGVIVTGGMVHMRGVMARLMMETGDFEGAVSLLKPLVFNAEAYPPWRSEHAPWQLTAELGSAAALAGDRDLVDRCLALLEASREAEDDPRHYLGQARILAADGQTDAAFDRLTLFLDIEVDLAGDTLWNAPVGDRGWWRTPRSRDQFVKFLVHPEPIGVLLGSDPRFQELIEPRG